MLHDILQILESNNVKMQKSKPGDKRNKKYCHICDRIMTFNKELDDTVILSHKTGFYVENRFLIKELVEIYWYMDY
jgi:capsid portal protein